jgi:hypothetical protein
VAASGALAVAALGGGRLAWWTGGTVAVVAGLAWRLFGRASAVHILGDAARYLTPHPANVAHRQSIREAGVSLLDRLHASGRYDRIVVLGHSLGSVIAYDVITHAWTEMHHRHRRPEQPAFGALVAVERALGLDDAEKAQDLQFAAWRQQRANTQPWLVTDLVTVGSPLAHAGFLMAPTPARFAQAQADRTLPRCPPVSERESKSGHERVTFDRPYRDAHGGHPRTFTMPHHGAPFAVTRWTNLFFEAGLGGLRGDIIGGPVSPQFGAWVRDVSLQSPGGSLAHTGYWRPVAGSTAHLDELRAALGLDARAELQAVAAAIPAFALLETGADEGDR